MINLVFYTYVLFHDIKSANTLLSSYRVVMF
jgi:hypothetical protein